MKNQIVLAALIVLTTLSAQAIKPTWAHYDGGFAPADARRQTWLSHVAMCDDSLYAGLSVSIPGRMGVDFTVEKPQWDGDCVVQGQRIEETERGGLRTRFFIKGMCNSQLVFRLIKQPKRTITMDMGDAC